MTFSLEFFTRLSRYFQAVLAMFSPAISSHTRETSISQILAARSGTSSTVRGNTPDDGAWACVSYWQSYSESLRRTLARSVLHAGYIRC
ncbi:hypothetical protein IQ06DRAFT_27104 [Phaeosphaeriaceae sp. SRC1lsM3a]|nr:hypothetical protein IQ06DRAFT_27104 [Stagonospora sp. SRC1lsM3a]